MDAQWGQYLGSIGTKQEQQRQQKNKKADDDDSLNLEAHPTHTYTQPTHTQGRQARSFTCTYLLTEDVHSNTHTLRADRQARGGAAGLLAGSL